MFLKRNFYEFFPLLYKIMCSLRKLKKKKKAKRRQQKFQYTDNHFYILAYFPTLKKNPKGHTASYSLFPSFPNKSQTVSYIIKYPYVVFSSDYNIPFYMIYLIIPYCWICRLFSFLSVINILATLSLQILLIIFCG